MRGRKWGRERGGRNMNQNDKFNLLRNKEILNILLGGSNYGQLNDGICMPYLSGQAVCDIAKQFGCNLNIFDGKLNKSRWKLLDELFDYCTINNSISRLGQQPVNQLPWGHIIVLMTRVDNPDERLIYAKMTVENGWSRNVLVHQIEMQTAQRVGKALTNFERTIPEPDSELAIQTLKDPYKLQFLEMVLLKL